jgi:hypothetical protein
MTRKWFIIAVLFPMFSLAQGKNKSNVTTIVSTGIIMGESAAKPLYQFSGGFTMDRWFAGAGAGYDAYQNRSIPVFADWRYSIGSRRLGFAYANIGYNFPTGDRIFHEPFWREGTLYGGFYMDAGAGLRFMLGGSHHLLLSAGYSQKNMEGRITDAVMCITTPCPEGATTIYNYSFGRLVLKMSWEFETKH